MKFAVIAHHARAAQADALARPLGATVFMDTGDHGAGWNHRRALAWAAEQADRVVFLEDDALPVAGWLDAALEWCRRFPDDLVSFYLGTSRPPQWQPEIRSRRQVAQARGDDYIVLPELVHGVAYTLPPGGPRGVLGLLSHTLPPDYALGRAWRALTGRPVVYPVASLVDHADAPSVERHPDGQARTERRRAWQLAEPATPYSSKPAFPLETK